MAAKRKRGVEPAKPARKKKPRAVPGEWQGRFLTAYRQSGIIYEAAREAGVHRGTVGDHCRVNPAFKAAMRAARADAADSLEGIARKRAEASSDVLLMFLLKGMRPHKYRERSQVDYGGKVIVEHDNSILRAVAENPAAAAAVRTLLECADAGAGTAGGPSPAGQ